MRRFAIIPHIRQAGRQAGTGGTFGMGDGEDGCSARCHLYKFYFCDKKRLVDLAWIKNCSQCVLHIG